VLKHKNNENNSDDDFPQIVITPKPVPQK